MWSSTLVVTFLLGAAFAQEQWTHLMVKWNAPKNNESFYPLPLTFPEAWAAGWIEIPEYANEDYQVYCMPGDPRVCTAYNDNGAIVAVDFSLIVSEVDNGCTSYDWSTMGYKKQIRWNIEVYTTRIWFYSQATAKNADISLSGNYGEGMWINIGNSLTNIPVTNATYPSNNYLWQNCIPTMGRHYYYNMNSYLQCENFQPIFLITNDQTGNLIGFGWQNFGHYSVESRSWFENISTSAIKATIPQLPTCLTDWVQKCGIVSLHVYMTSEPWKQKCGPVA